MIFPTCRKCSARRPSAVWPTPIPLFGLGLGLGWLAYRTRRLVAPVTLHVLFNAVGVGMLLLSS